MDEARTRTISWSDPAATAASGRDMSGLDYLAALRDGTLPPAPIILLVGIRLETLENGRVTMSLTPGEHLYNPLGTVHGGAIGTILDSVMGCAVHSTLPKGRSYTTLELKVNYIRALNAAVGDVIAEGNVVHAGRRSAVAEARLVDAKGKIYATASTTCLIFDLPA